jgi:hypothetical protein
MKPWLKMTHIVFARRVLRACILSVPLSLCPERQLHDANSAPVYQANCTAIIRM